MTDMSDKSPEAYAARLRQIIKQREQAVTQARKLLHPLSAEKHEQVLEIITGSAWNGELDLSEHWIFLQIFEKSCDILRAVRHEMNLELMARYRVMIWVHQASSPLEGSTAERDILKLNADEARFHLRLLEGFISNRHMMNKRQIEDLCCQISIKIEEIEKIEKIFERSMENGANAWIEYFLSLIENERDWHASKRLPKIPEGGHSEVLKQLITLDEKYRYKDAVTADGLTDPWKSSFGDAFSVALAGELDDEAKQLFLEKQVAPIAFLSPYGGYGQKTPKLIEEAYEAGLPCKNHLLAAARRATQINAGYTDAAAYKWAADILTPELNPGEAWSDAFLARLDALPAAERQPWPALVAYARTAIAGKPSAKWLKEGQKHLDAVGAETFRRVLSEALPLLSRPRTFPLREDSHYTGNPNLLIDEFNAQSLKGLLWLAPLAGADATLARAVAGVVDSALKKVAGVGPRAPKVANAAVYALSQMESDAALSALARLSSTVTFKGTLKEVQKGLNAVAERLNTSPEDLLELGVPTLGMGSVGERLEQWGDVEVRLTVDASGAKLTFSKGGKPLKSVPASVKKDFADDLKELKAAQKEAEKAVAALSQRLDSLMISGKTWRGDVWQERYLNHPLAGTVARRLIWRIDGVPALWHEGHLLPLSPCGGGALRSNGEGVGPDSEISLWHPLDEPVDDVLAWRDRLEALDVRQPFKQAWREIYLLTDAERRTETYSNRFAGHILKQHQFNQLAALRGWRNRLRLMVDDSYPPATRDLPEYGLRAEYWIEGK